MDSDEDNFDISANNGSFFNASSSGEEFIPSDNETDEDFSENESFESSQGVLDVIDLNTTTISHNNSQANSSNHTLNDTLNTGQNNGHSENSESTADENTPISKKKKLSKDEKGEQVGKK